MIPRGVYNRYTGAGGNLGLSRDVKVLPYHFMGSKQLGEKFTALKVAVSCS
jgi:hypothetical protein